MKKVLFICGFHTHLEENMGIHVYSPIDVYFTFSKYTVEYFHYKTTESLHDVYKRLKEILESNEHDIIITHSMGSCLYLKYVSETKDQRKCVLCMPFIQATTFMKWINYLPFSENILLPKCLMLPNSNIVDSGNILNDNIKLLSCKQVHTAVNDYFLEETELQNLILSHTNLHILYSENELISPIDKSLLFKIKEKVTYVPGKHMSFSNAIFMGAFFDAFTKIIEEK